MEDIVALIDARAAKPEKRDAPTKLGLTRQQVGKELVRRSH
jgi:hypothetical protein